MKKKKNNNNNRSDEIDELKILNQKLDNMLAHEKKNLFENEGKYQTMVLKNT